MNDIDSDKFINRAEKNIDFSYQPLAVLPGQDVTNKISGHSKTIKIGTGLEMLDNPNEVQPQIRCTIAGVLRYRAPASYWVESSNIIYIPKVNDQVVGIVEDRTSDFYKINIFSTAPALLNKLAFEGATKRNKPELKKGDIVYVRVTMSHKDLDYECTCISSSGVKKEWSTGEAIYGPLDKGLVLVVPVGVARAMLLPDNVVLNALGR